VGIAGGKIYKRSELDSFPEAGLWKMLVFDVLWIILAIMIPYSFYTFYFFTKGLLFTDWLYLGIYSILVFLTLITHSNSCKKCPIDGCPLSKGKKDLKKG
jgi:hypothetical protein